MASKQKKTDYSLKRRFFSETGNPHEWIDFGKGEFTDLETVQSQIKTLASQSRKVEIEFIREGKLRDYQGNETGKTMIFDKR
jgi:hypothetical protein